MRIAPATSLSAAELGAAERDSYAAVRHVAQQLAVAIGCIVLLPPLAIALVASMPVWPALMVYTAVAIPLLTLVFLLGRKGAKAAASGISVALAVASGGVPRDLADFPRLEYIVNRLVPVQRGA